MFKGGVPNMQSMMKQVQKMQEKVAQVQAELESQDGDCRSRRWNGESYCKWKTANTQD